MEIIDRITKLQAGGVSPAMASFIQVPDPQPSAPFSAPGKETTEESKKENPGLLDDKQKTLLYEKGLPSDVEQFLSMVDGLSNNIFGGTYSSNYGLTNTEMTKIDSALNRIRFNKEQFDNALKNITANGGLQEVAVTNTGRMVVQDEEGQIKQITPTEYYKNKDKYAMLTNADVADIRANNPSLAFNSNIIAGTLNNGIGMQTINSIIQENIDKIGKTTVQSDKYASKLGSKVTQGLQELLSDESADGVYKVTQKQSTQSDKAKYALEYLFATLPENAKTVLKAKAAAMGKDPQTGAYELITMLVQSKLTDDVSTSISYDKQASADISGGGAGSEGSQTNQGPLDLFINGESTDKRTFTINPGTNLSYEAYESRVFNGLPTNDNKGLAPTFMTLGKALSTTALGSMGKRDSVFFGDELVPDTALDRVVIDTKNVAQVFLPATEDNQGRVVPDYDTLFKLEKLEETISNRGTITEQEKKELYDSAGLSDYFGTDKDPKLAYQRGLLKPFMAVTGLAAENDQYGITENNRAANKLPSADKTAYIRQMYSVYQKEDPKDKFNDFDKWYLPNADVYRGTILVPISNDRLTAQALTGNIYLPKSTFNAKRLLQRSQSMVNGLKGLGPTNFTSNDQE